MASNLRVDNIQPSTGTGIGIGTANGSVTFNADVTGGMNIATGSVGVGTDNPDHALHLYSGTLGIGKSENTGFEILIGDNNINFSRDAKSYINQLGTGTISVRLGSSYTEVAEFTSDGLKFPSGKGIDFSATSDASGMTSEILSDYEEGTWTPVFAGATTAGTYTYSDQIGRYTKIGRLVHVQFRLTNITTSSAGSGAIHIQGLPFVSTYSSTGGNLRLDNFDIQSSTNNIAIIVNASGSYLAIYSTRDSIGDNALTATARLNNVADLIGDMIYYVD